MIATCQATSVLIQATVFLVAFAISLFLALVVFWTTDKATGRDLPPIK